MGPFPTAVRQLKFLVVVIDYFTISVEAKALATITKKNIRSFVWRSIICRYGIPRVLVSDNGKQFDNDTLKDFCSQLGIKNHYSSPAHPTTARTLIGETPFRLAYGIEALIPAEVGLTSYRMENYDKSKNDEALRLQLDLVDEVRDAAKQRLARYQDPMAKHYNSKVRHRDFQVGDLEGNVLLRDTRRKKAESSMEHGALEEILPVNKGQRRRQHLPPHFHFIFR
ncbi:uncharacterized protein LOC142632673 [Castanea sativa]|uniref:uncharacterized protein LOC142632673 n=1 Tax=Castanea sativa TaxID=21020 RepID=UPI003F650C1B